MFSVNNTPRIVKTVYRIKVNGTRVATGVEDLSCLLQVYPHIQGYENVNSWITECKSTFGEDIVVTKDIEYEKVRVDYDTAHRIFVKYEPEYLALRNSHKALLTSLRNSGVVYRSPEYNTAVMASVRTLQNHHNRRRKELWVTPNMPNTHSIVPTKRVS
jgi:hypothetical protein